MVKIIKKYIKHVNYTENSNYGVKYDWCVIFLFEYEEKLMYGIHSDVTYREARLTCKDLEDQLCAYRDVFNIFRTYWTVRHGLKNYLINNKFMPWWELRGKNESINFKQN